MAPPRSYAQDIVDHPVVITPLAFFPAWSRAFCSIVNDGGIQEDSRKKKEVHEVLRENSRLYFARFAACNTGIFLHST